MFRQILWEGSIGYSLKHTSLTRLWWMINLIDQPVFPGVDLRLHCRHLDLNKLYCELRHYEYDHNIYLFCNFKKFGQNILNGYIQVQSIESFVRLCNVTFVQMITIITRATCSFRVVSVFSLGCFNHDACFSTKHMLAISSIGRLIMNPDSAEPMAKQYHFDGNISFCLFWMFGHFSLFMDDQCLWSTIDSTDRNVAAHFIFDKNTHRADSLCVLTTASCAPARIITRAILMSTNTFDAVPAVIRPHPGLTVDVRSRCADKLILACHDHVIKHRSKQNFCRVEKLRFMLCPSGPCVLWLDW